MNAGAPTLSHYQTLGTFLYDGVFNQGVTLHMFFYCLGGFLWYYLFYKSSYIPRIIPLLGLLAVLAAFVALVVEFFGYDVSIFLSLPLLPFELTIGFWLLLRSVKDSQQSGSLRVANQLAAL